MVGDDDRKAVDLFRCVIRSFRIDAEHAVRKLDCRECRNEKMADVSDIWIDIVDRFLCDAFRIIVRILTRHSFLKRLFLSEHSSGLTRKEKIMVARDVLVHRYEFAVFCRYWHSVGTFEDGRTLVYLVEHSDIDHLRT